MSTDVKKDGTEDGDADSLCSVEFKLEEPEKQLRIPTVGGTAPDARIVRYEMICRNLNVCVAMMSVLGTFAQMLRMELCWDDTFLILLRVDSCQSGLLLSYFTIGTSFITVNICVLFYYYKSLIEMARWGYSTTSDAFFKTNLPRHFTFEILLLMIQPYPRILPPSFNNPEVLVAIMLLRFSYVFMAARDYSLLFQNRETLKTEITSSGDKIFHSVGTGRAFKIYFLRHSMAMIAGMYFFFWIFFSYIVYILERGYFQPCGDNANPPTQGHILVDMSNRIVPDTDLWSYSDFNEFFICCWMIGITMLTVGYGDFTAQTGEGKVVVMFACLVGMVMTSLVVSAVTAALSSTTPFQNTLNDWLRDFELRKVAVGLIEMKWRQTLDIKNNKMQPTGHTLKRERRKKERLKKKLRSLRVIPPEPEDEGENRKMNLEEVKKVNVLFEEIAKLLNDTGRLDRNMRQSFRKSMKAKRSSNTVIRT